MFYKVVSAALMACLFLIFPSHLDAQDCTWLDNLQFNFSSPTNCQRNMEVSDSYSKMDYFYLSSTDGSIQYFSSNTPTSSASINNLNSGWYFWYATSDGSSCNKSDYVFVPEPTEYTSSAKAPLNCGEASGEISITGNIVGFSVELIEKESSTVIEASQVITNSPFIISTQLDALKYYDIIVTDDNNCVVIQSLLIPDGEDCISSDLPIVIINTDGGSEIYNEPKVSSDMKIIDRGDGQRNYFEDKDNPTYLDYDGRIGIEKRGNSSQYVAPKKSYGFETRDAIGEDLNASLLGMPSENDWVLSAYYFDKTLIRNSLSLEISRRMGHWASRNKFVEVYLNGEYQGIYILMEKVKWDKNRLDIEKLDPTDTIGDAVTGGYIYQVAQSGYDFGQRRRFHYPKGEDVHQKQYDYIKSYDDSFRSIMAGSNYSDPVDGYASKINTNTFIDEIIVQEITKNSDAYGWSSFFYKDRNAKLSAGPAWDFDQALGNSTWNCGQCYNEWNLTKNVSAKPAFWKELFNESEFQCQLRQRYEELRNGPLHLDSLLNYIDVQATILTEAQERNFNKWDILGKAIWRSTPGYQDRDTYQKEVDYLKDYVTNRLNWMDTELADMSACSTPAASPLIISEIMYNAPDNGLIEGDEFEFLEIKNNSNNSVDLSNMTLTNAVRFVFPKNTILNGNEYIVLAENSVNFEIKYGFAPFAQYSGGLGNTTEKIVLNDAYGRVIDEVTYENKNGWPEDPDGKGTSLELCEFNGDNSNPINWKASASAIGTPGNDNSICNNLICENFSEKLIITEINYNSDDVNNTDDWVEIFNGYGSDIDLTDWYFQDEAHAVELPSLVLKPGEYLVMVRDLAAFGVIHQNVENAYGPFSFGLSGGGERLRLMSPQNCVVDWIDYDDEDPWPLEADGLGASLAFCDYDTDNSNSENWYASDKAGGTPGEANQVCSFVLPIELSSFTGKAQGCNVQLNWATQLEENFSHFELQRSVDGRDYEVIKIIQGTGGSHNQAYQYLDLKTNLENYYRLKAIDLDDTYDYSSIIYVKTDCDEAEPNMILFPNPIAATQSQMTVKFYTEVENTLLTISNAQGTPIRKFRIPNERGWNTIRVDVNDLVPGTYFLSYGSHTKMISGRFVKSRL